MAALKLTHALCPPSQELVAKQQSLQHDLGVAQEHWKAEEGVRIRCAMLPA